MYSTFTFVTFEKARQDSGVTKGLSNSIAKARLGDI
jgi:hypothetical protein